MNIVKPLHCEPIICDRSVELTSSESMDSCESSSSTATIIRKMSDANLSQIRNSVLGFSTPLSKDFLSYFNCSWWPTLLYAAVGWFLSVNGTEYCHTYFWIAKDLAWMQGWRYLVLTIIFRQLLSYPSAQEVLPLFWALGAGLVIVHLVPRHSHE